MRPSEIQLAVWYPNDDPSRGGGMDQGDYDNGEIGSDNLRTIAEMLGLATFNRLEPQFQRNYIAMCVAAKLEADLLVGVGTGWRDWDQQMANHLANPRQFAHPMYSLHMNRGKYNVAYAIDTVPYDALDWLHANCARFGINYLDHIAHERHHCQPIQIPNGGSQFNDYYAELAREVLDLPYLRTMSLTAWLERDAPIHVDGRDENSQPTPQPPVPVPPASASEEDPMIPVVVKTTDGGAQFAAFGGPGSPCYHIPTQISEAYVFGRGNGRALDLGSGRVVSWSPDSPGSWAAVKAVLSKAQVFAIHPPVG